MILQINFQFDEFKLGILCFVTAFVVAMIFMPPLIKLINKFKLYDVPDIRKEHSLPVPTMGGIAVIAGMAVACFLWFKFKYDLFIISFFFSIAILFALGIMDDLKNISVRYKFVIQIAVACLIAFCGVRITSFNGLFGIFELPISAQYSFTILAIVGITNAFNLIDGIDGLAGGLGFMSLVVSGLFLTLAQDSNIALIAFSLAGGLLGFLYYNFNPARVFMGDTGSLVLGFVVAVLCVRLMHFGSTNITAVIPHTPVFALGIVLIPVFDTLRVFALRMWQGQSPFNPDKTHIHHLLTTNGWSHGFTSKLICSVHGFILLLTYFLKDVRQELGMLILFFSMLLMVFIFKRFKVSHFSGVLQAKKVTIKIDSP